MFPKLLILTGVIALVLCATTADARRGETPATMRNLGRPVAAIPVLEITPSDVDALLAEDEAATAAGSKSLRYADPRAVLATPATDGVWDRLTDGTRLWRLRISAPGATDLNLGFTRFHVPAGTSLYVIAEGRDYYEGPYTHEDNETHGELWVPVVPGERAIIELRVPVATKFQPDIELTHVGYGYRDLFGERIGIARQGSCNNDVVCPEAAPWAAEIQSVAAYSTGGSAFCTGQMIMDVPGTFTPYFLTANHCGMSSGNAASLVVYWNFHSPQCGDLCCGSLSDNQTGSFWRAGRSDVDFTLLELDDFPSPASNVYWAGWDATGAVPQGSVAIHHPNGDEKAISFNTDPLTTQNSCIGGGTNTHWRVNNWEDGTTEPGSSGSGLWDPDTHLLVGFLSGGLASCTVIDYDCYGKFSVAWDGPGSTSRLRDWLDPGGSGTMQVPGSFADGSGTMVFAGQTSEDLCTDPISNQNGVWEPGEVVTIRVNVAAIGADMTSVTGVLSSSSADVTIVDAAATWPDITSGTTETCDAPYFTVEVSPGAACYSTVNFELNVTSEEVGPILMTFSAEIGQTLEASDLPVGTSDNASVTSQLDVAQDVTITDLDVHVDMNHTWVGDLSITITSPSNTTVTLLDRPGVPASTFGCSDDDLDVIFDDDAGFPTENHCAGTTPWLTGPASPVSPLSAFNGESTAGTWTLTVTDGASGDSGTLNTWQLLSTPELSGTCAGCGDVVAVGGAPGAGRAMLAQNRPNPFNPQTSITFGVPNGGGVSLEIYSTTGRLVRTLVDETMDAGTYEIVWDGTDAAGRPMASGLYFYRLETGEERLVRRMSLLR
jgi:subtilisin-like proprotein convertase family protein